MGHIPWCILSPGSIFQKLSDLCLAVQLLWSVSSHLCDGVNNASTSKSYYERKENNLSRTRYSVRNTPGFNKLMLLSFWYDWIQIPLELDIIYSWYMYQWCGFAVFTKFVYWLGNTVALQWKKLETLRLAFLFRSSFLSFWVHRIPSGQWPVPGFASTSLQPNRISPLSKWGFWHWQQCHREQSAQGKIWGWRVWALRMGGSVMAQPV